MFRLFRASFLVVGVLALAGCFSTDPGPSTTAHPSPPVPSTASAMPSTTPATPGASCENIVTPTALTELTSAPSEFFPDFTRRMRTPGSQLYRFIQLGGIACEWGHPNSDVVFDLATSAITDAQAATEKAALIQLGWSSSPDLAILVAVGRVSLGHDLAVSQDHRDFPARGGVDLRVCAPQGVQLLDLDDPGALCTDPATSPMPSAAAAVATATVINV